MQAGVSLKDALQGRPARRYGLEFYGHLEGITVLCICLAWPESPFLKNIGVNKRCVAEFCP